MVKSTNKNVKKVQKKKPVEESSEKSESLSESIIEYSQEQLEIAEKELEGSYSESESDSESSSSSDAQSFSLKSESEESTKSGSTPEEEDDSKRTIYIKGIDYDLKEDELRDQMSRLGEVVRVTIPLTHDFKRNKGFAYVEFKNLSDTEKGLKLNDTELLGKRVSVTQAMPRSNKKIFTVFCKNLAYNTTKDDIHKHFSKYGKVFNVSLPVDMSNQDRNKGFCFVEFNDEEIVEKVLKGKHVIGDRTLFLNSGNKNEERNAKRSSDRLYGRSNQVSDRKFNDRGGRGQINFGDREQRNFGDRDNGSFKKRKFEDDRKPFNKNKNSGSIKDDRKRNNKLIFEDD